MKFHSIAAAALAALTFASGPAGATATASASLTHLTVKLSPISTDAGAPAPSAIFNVGSGGSSVYSITASGAPYAYEFSITDGGAAFSPVTNSVASAYGSTNGSISGDVSSAAGASVSASSRADGTELGQSTYSQSTTFLGDGGSSMTFTLGPNTLLDISGTAVLSTSVGSASSPSGDEDAYTYVYLALSGTDSQANSVLVDDYVLDTAGSLQRQGSDGSFDIAVHFVGSRTETSSGAFYGYVEADADSTVPAIPEPSGLALLAAGLGVLRVVARRRRTAPRQ